MAFSKGCRDADVVRLTSVGSRDCFCGMYALALFDCVLG